MQEIVIRYQPLPLLSITRQVKGQFPETWEEMTPEQLIALSGLSERDPLPRLESVFTGIPERICRKLDRYQVTSIWWLTDWVGGADSHNAFIIRTLSTKKYLLHSPEPRLRKVTFGQFIFFDMAYVNYLEGKKSQDLDRFLSSLYIPEGIPFSDELPLMEEPSLKQIPGKVKEAILFNYALVRRWLAGQYPLLFSNPEEKVTGDDQGLNIEEGLNVEKKQPKRFKNHGNWIKVFDNIVGDDISRHEEYGNIPLHNVLRYLTQKTKESMKSKSCY